MTIFTKVFIMLVIGAVDFVYCRCRFFRTGVSPLHQNEIINKHNHLRYLLLNGTVPGQPQAINLMPLRYDAELAYAAQVAANTCKFSHYYPDDPRWNRVGQNVAEGGASFVNSEPDWNRVIQVWFDEHKNYYYPNAPDKRTSQYVQIASDEVKYVGCGYSYFFDTRYKMPSFVKLYVCNYGPEGSNKNKPPYVTHYMYKKSRKCT